MLLRRRDKQDDDAKVAYARHLVDDAVSKMTRVLDDVQRTADIAKEELDERRVD